MKTVTQIQSEALRTQDPAVLYSLVEAALKLAEFEAARAALSQAREQKLKQQVQRQIQMITNLEQTLKST